MGTWSILPSNDYTKTLIENNTTNSTTKEFVSASFSFSPSVLGAAAHTQCREEDGLSDGMPTSVGGCGPMLVLVGAAGRGLRRGGSGLEGRMRGGGWFRADRGCRKRACCWRGGGWRCSAGVAGREGRNKGGGWFKDVLPLAAAMANDATAMGEGPEAGVTWPCKWQGHIIIYLLDMKHTKINILISI